MIYETDRLILKTINIDDLLNLQNYLNRNREFLREWEPSRNDSYYSLSGLKKLINKEEDDFIEQSRISLYIYIKGKEDIIGNVTISNIVKGAFQSCFLGYKLDKDEINQGYITEAIKKIVEIAFNELNLHRI